MVDFLECREKGHSFSGERQPGIYKCHCGTVLEIHADGHRTYSYTLLINKKGE